MLHCICRDESNQNIFHGKDEDNGREAEEERKGREEEADIVFLCVALPKRLSVSVV